MSIRGDEVTLKFRSTVRDLGLLRPGDVVLAGLSGGADSVALLLLLLEYREREDPTLKVSCCHLNHMLRGEEADADQAFCERLCSDLGVGCVVERADVSRRAAEQGIGIEQAAREARYRFFEDVAGRIGASSVALGHQADDNAETVLYRAVRGAGTRGLVGIRPVRPISPTSAVLVIRPLIRHTSDEIRRYLSAIRPRSWPTLSLVEGSARGVKWREDSSNVSLRFARNRMRRVILPALEKQFSARIGEMLNRLSVCARGLDDFARARVRELMTDPRLTVAADEIRFPVEWMLSVTESLRAEMLLALLERLGAPLGGLTRNHLARLSALSTGEGSASRMSLPGCAVERSYGFVRIFRGAVAREPLRETILIVPGVTVLPKIGALRAEFVDAKGFDLASFVRRKGTHEEALDMGRLIGTLRVRRRRPGDRFRPFGGGGGRKLQDFFTDLKIPASERRAIPIVSDDDGIVWVVGYRLDERVRVTPATRRVLKLTFEPIAD